MKKKEKGTVLIIAVLSGTILLGLAILISMSINTSMEQAKTKTTFEGSIQSLITAVINSPVQPAKTTPKPVVVGSTTSGIKVYTAVLKNTKTKKTTENFNVPNIKGAVLSQMYISLIPNGKAGEWTINNSTGVVSGKKNYLTTSSSAVTPAALYITNESAVSAKWSITVDSNATTTNGYIMYARVFYK